MTNQIYCNKFSNKVEQSIFDTVHMCNNYIVAYWNIQVPDSW